jgi:hypothetical protein
MQNIIKFAHFEIFIFIHQSLTQTCDILRQLYLFIIASSKIFYSKNPSYKKWKELKKTHNCFIK